VTEELQEVLEYFDATASRFAAIYTAPRLVDRLFRRDMYERLRRTLDACAPLAGTSVLDIGCGSGEYTVALAVRGAATAVGLDFAGNMLAIARERARAAGVAEQCQFLLGDFLSYPFGRPFDYAIAIGVFDYLKDPAPVLARARDITTQRFVATFPRRFTWRALVRKVRLSLAGCPVFFYTRRRVLALMRQAGFLVETCERCGKLHFVTARPDLPPGG